MLAHADDASFGDGSGREIAQLVVPLCIRLTGSRLSTLGPCLGDEFARPILGAAEQFHGLRSFVPNNRYPKNINRAQRMFLLYTIFLTVLDPEDGT